MPFKCDVFYFLRLSNENNTLRLINLLTYYKDKIISLKEKLIYSFMTNENNKTIAYYNLHVQSFCTVTNDVYFTAIEKKF